MKEALISLNNRLAPAEKVFFTWLSRVIAAAVLAGSAWIDDAPPLELVALIFVLYVAVRTLSQYGELVRTAPFENSALNVLFAIVALIVLVAAFLIVVIFVNHLSLFSIA